MVHIKKKKNQNLNKMLQIAKTWKQPRCPPKDEWIKKVWYIYTMEYTHP